ncbi:MAG: DUF167 domain-containing protein [Actinobacteria bacterium]|nr:DUF167 domain-containing protein [Actinomycetota bacterium]
MVPETFDITAEGDVVLRLHVQPGAGRTAVMGTFNEALKVRVAAPPQGGRANDAVLALVADLLGVKPAQLELTSGASGRDKRVKVTGVEVDDVRRLIESAVDTGNAGAGPGVQRPVR